MPETSKSELASGEMDLRSPIAVVCDADGSFCTRVSIISCLTLHDQKVRCMKEKAKRTLAAYLVGVLRRLLLARGVGNSGRSVGRGFWNRTRRVVIRAQLLDSRLLQRRRLLQRPLPGSSLSRRLLARRGARAAREAQAGLAARLLQRAGPGRGRPRRHLDIGVQRAEDASLGWRRGCAHLGKGAFWGCLWERDLGSGYSPPRDGLVQRRASGRVGCVASRVGRGTHSQKRKASGWVMRKEMQQLTRRGRDTVMKKRTRKAKTCLAVFVAVCCSNIGSAGEQDVDLWRQMLSCLD